MATLDRRDYMKTMMGGAVLLTLSTPALASVADGKQGTATTAHTAFWTRVDAAKARELAESAIKAARAEVKMQRALGASQRAAILLGAEASAPYHKQAAMHYETRTTELRKTKDALSRFVKSAGDSGERHFATFLEKGGMKEFVANARKSTIEALLHSETSPDDTRSALKALDERLGAIQQTKSFADLTAYLDHHLDELVQRKMPEQDQNGLCILVLIITSLFALLVVLALIICIFTLGAGCSGILNQLLDQACPE
jgi:hypothetical protein